MLLLLECPRPEGRDSGSCSIPSAWSGTRCVPTAQYTLVECLTPEETEHQALPSPESFWEMTKPGFKPTLQSLCL